MSTVSLSTSTFDNALVLSAIMFAARGALSPTQWSPLADQIFPGRSAGAALLALAFATHFSLPLGLLAAPLILLLLGRPSSQLASPRFHAVFEDFNRFRAPLVQYAGMFALYFLALTGLAALSAGDFSFGWMRQTWGLGYVDFYDVFHCYRD
jgi:hypothetical protein